MPQPQALVAFMVTLFVLLVATHSYIRIGEAASAAISVVLATGLAWVVNSRIPEDAQDEDDITEEAELETGRRE